MGYFDGTTYVTGGQTADDGRAGSEAGIHPRQQEPLARRDLVAKAKMLVPSGGRDGEPPRAPFDGRSNSGRRDITRAAEFVASMDEDQAEAYRSWLASEQSELDDTVGPAEDGREEQNEKLFLTLDLADRVEEATAEMVEDQRDFMDWASEQFGGPEEFDRWFGKQGDADDQYEALHELAQDYTADVEFYGWIAASFGDELMERLEQLDNGEYEEAMSDLAHAFVGEDDESDEFDDDVDDGDYELDE